MTKPDFSYEDAVGLNSNPDVARDWSHLVDADPAANERTATRPSQKRSVDAAKREFATTFGIDGNARRTHQV
ncbi:MAG: hypothetical protein Q8R02_18965 [Hyphomonadaceae bacterium]|nr:hypothetical protein [Hyphomonadaceae bacterium]